MSTMHRCLHRQLRTETLTFRVTRHVVIKPNTAWILCCYTKYNIHTDTQQFHTSSIFNKFSFLLFIDKKLHPNYATAININIFYISQRKTYQFIFSIIYVIPLLVFISINFKYCYNPNFTTFSLGFTHCSFLRGIL